jgi:hypothetical protein
MTIKLSLDDDYEHYAPLNHTTSTTIGIKRSATTPAVMTQSRMPSKRRVVTEPHKGGFIADKKKERHRNNYGAIHQSEVLYTT